MYDNHAKGISYSAGFFMLIAFAIAGLMLASLITVPVWTAMTGQSFEAFKEGMTNPAYSNAYKAAQAINAICSYFIPALLVAFLLNRKPLQLLGFSGKIKPGQAGLSVLLIMLSFLVSTALAYFNKAIPIPGDWQIKFESMEADYIRQVEAIMGLNNTGEYIVAMVVLAFLPALCEEVMFRGGLQNFLTRSSKNYWLSVITVSLIFSAAHLSYYGFLSRFFLSVVLGLIFQYSGRLWLSILAHFFYNGYLITTLYYAKTQGIPISEKAHAANSNWWGIFILPLLIGLFIYFRKISDNSAAQNTVQ